MSGLLDLSAEVARLHAEVAMLRLEREQDMDEIRAACAMAEFVLWTCRSLDHQLAGPHQADLAPKTLNTPPAYLLPPRD